MDEEQVQSELKRTRQAIRADFNYRPPVLIFQSAATSVLYVRLQQIWEDREGEGAHDSEHAGTYVRRQRAGCVARG